MFVNILVNILNSLSFCSVIFFNYIHLFLCLNNPINLVHFHEQNIHISELLLIILFKAAHLHLLSFLQSLDFFYGFFLSRKRQNLVCLQVSHIDRSSLVFYHQPLPDENLFYES